MRINKYIASSGYCSRRQADKYIIEGKVVINGVLNQDPSYKVSEQDIVQVNGKEIFPEEKVYYMLNKPVGYMSSLKDPNFDKFVVDLIDDNRRIYPVGRLDVDSRGLILLTNDGEFTNKLTHPSNEISKKYEIITKKSLSKDDIIKFKKGVDIGDESKVKGVIKHIEGSKYEIVIFEGRNRQIRRMLESIGNEVLDLKRIEIGPFSLGELKEKEYRHLSTEELDRLKDL